MTNATASLDAEQKALLAEAADLLPMLQRERKQALAARLEAAIDALDFDALGNEIHAAKHALKLLCGHCGADLDGEPRSSWGYCSQDCYWQDGGGL